MQNTPQYMQEAPVPSRPDSVARQFRRLANHPDNKPWIERRCGEKILSTRLRTDCTSFSNRSPRPSLKKISNESTKNGLESDNRAINGAIIVDARLATVTR